MMFGTIAKTEPADCERMIHRALEFGINFIDTADRYSAGQSEEIVGQAVKGRRDTVVLATKFTAPMGEDPNKQGGSRRWIMQAVEGSLRRLQTDYIDIYQMQRMPADVDIEEVLSALTDLMRAGKVRTIGSSTAPASDIVEAQWVADRRALARFRCEQSPYNILNRSVEREVLPACQRYGMGVMAWSPLAKGMLTGKYRKGEPTPDGLRAKMFAKAMSDGDGLDAVEQLVQLAQEAGLSLIELGLGFAVSHPAVTSAIIGARTMEQLSGLLAGASTTLSDEILDRIDEIVSPGVDVAPLEASGYSPSSILQKPLRRRAPAERAIV